MNKVGVCCHGNALCPSNDLHAAVLSGRVEPVPFELKDDHLGLGRWAMELEQAADATEKRKQMEAEKEVTAERVEKYKVSLVCVQISYHRNTCTYHKYIV